VLGAARTKHEVLHWVQGIGVTVLEEMLGAGVEDLVGPKDQHQAERKAYRWGQTDTVVPLGGRRLRLKRPRVRSTEGRELRLPILEQFQSQDAMPERVVEQIVLGVSTRGYGASLERLPADVVTRGTSKSSASRQLVERTKAKAQDYLTRPLGDLKLLGLVLDGLAVAEHAIVVALGVTEDGRKIPLGLWQGSTENATVCTALLQNLLERGLKVEDRILAVIDGGKGLRKALRDVFGDRVLIQRCQVHKTRNILEHLPRHRRSYVRRMLRDAYRSKNAATARRLLQSLSSWLERNGEDGAAASLREGLEESLTVLKLEISPTLRRSLSTTNCIENLMGTIRRVARNVKRWSGGSMVRRWATLGLVVAEQRFRRIKGHRDLPSLMRALHAQPLASESEAA
jgi:transposase-like protein